MTTPSEVIVHLVYQDDRSTVSFSPDVQDGFYHSYQCGLYYNIYQKRAFLCGQSYRGCVDLITHLPEKTTCPKCKSTSIVPVHPKPSVESVVHGTSPAVRPGPIHSSRRDG